MSGKRGDDITQSPGRIRLTVIRGLERNCRRRIGRSRYGCILRGRRDNRNQAENRHRVVLHARIAAAPGHGVVVVVPRIMQIDRIGRRIVSKTKHGMPADLNQDGPTSVDLAHIIGKSETERISVVAVDVLVEILRNRITSGLHEQPHPMTTVPPARLAAGIVVKWRTIRIVIESSSTVHIRVLGLISPHVVAGTIALGMLEPAVENVRVRPRVVVIDPVIVHMSACGSAILAHMSGNERTLAAGHRRIRGTTPKCLIVHRAHAAVGGPAVHVGISNVVIVSHQHTGRSGGASIAPGEGGNIAQGVDPQSDIGDRDFRSLGPIDQRRSAGNDNLIDELAVLRECPNFHVRSGNGNERLAIGIDLMIARHALLGINRI